MILKNDLLYFFKFNLYKFCKIIPLEMAKHMTELQRSYHLSRLALQKHTIRKPSLYNAFPKILFLIY